MLLIDGVKYELWTPTNENELEQIVNEHSQDIFGEKSIYFDTKKRLKSASGIVSIPDGYAIVIAPKPDWHVVEIELSSHPPYEHIVPQVDKFINAVDYKNTQNEIVEALYSAINNDDILRVKTLQAIGRDKDIHKFLTDLVSRPPTITIIIEQNTAQLKEALKKYSQKRVVEFQTFVREGTETVHAHLFEPLYEDTTQEIIKEVRNLPHGTREWVEDGIVWVREGTYDHKSETNNVEGELQAQGYKTEVIWVPKDWRTDPYWRDAKRYVVYRTKELAPERLKIMGGRATGSAPQDTLEITIQNPTYMKYHLFYIPKDKRSFFPGYRVHFMLETDVGIIQTYVSSAPAGTQVGDLNAGVYFQSKLAEWYRRHPAIKVGDKVRFQVIEPMKKYHLEIVGS